MGLNSTKFPLAIVSTDTTALREISWTLSTFGYQAVACSDWSEHAPWQRLNGPALVILDARDKQETQAALAVSRSVPYAYRIALYDAELQANPDVLVDLGADDLVRYPINVGELVSSLRRGARRLEFEQRFKISTTFDLQSGVANRRGFTRQLERRLQDKGNATNSALVVLGVDFLETIHQQYGLVAVERACGLAAEILYGELAAEDSRGILAEGIYAALLQGRSLSDGVLFAEEIASLVNERNVPSVYGPQISLSGVVFDWPSGDTADGTIDRALAALRHVRGCGGNHVLDANEVEHEYSAWKQEFSAQQVTDAQHVMEALPLVLPINAVSHASGLGVYSFALSPLPPCVPVVDDAGHLLGVVEPQAFRTHGKDVFGSLDEHLEPVSATLRAGSRLGDIAALLKTADKNYLLVVENKKPIGYITHETLAALELKTDDEDDDGEFALVGSDLSSLVVPLN